MVSHWLQFETDEPFVPNLKKFGFVYLIINTQNGKGYVGCKQYYIGKAKTASKWETYMGSSKYLKSDIKKIGKENFRFEVIAEYKNKRSLRYYEMHYQVKWSVLTAVIEGTDEPAFYNSYVGGKFYPPVELYQDPEFKQKMRENNWGNKEVQKKNSERVRGDKSSSALGPVELEFKNGTFLTVPNLSRWAMDHVNNYDWANLLHMIKGYKTNYGKKVNMYRHKDIIGVRLIGKEETNGN